MFYHFKGTITAEDFQPILSVMTKRMMFMFSGMMIIIMIVNLFMAANVAWSLVSAVILLVLGNLFLRWMLTSRFKKNFKPQEIDIYITEEQIRAQMMPRNVEIFADRVHFFQGRNQAMIFKKDMLENQGQWEDFVKMSQKFVPVKKSKQK